MTVAFTINRLLVLAFVAATIPNVMQGFVLETDIPTKKCKYSRVSVMIQVRCSKLELDLIPSNLKTEVQILDASVNRIRELKNDSLTAYTSLQYLYLGDNFITDIEEGAFNSLQYLKVLDLSTNGFITLPKSIFQLPYLERLYLSVNKLTDDIFAQINIKSPLIFLQLSKNKFSRIPQLGPLHTLKHLNVSENQIASIGPEDIAPFCSLEVVDFTKNPLKFDANNCECSTFNAWLSSRNIISRPKFNCTEELKKNCLTKQPEFSNRTIELYERCSEILQVQIKTERARNTWILVACCIGGFLFCLSLGLFCVHKRNKRRKKKKLKEEQRLNANNANSELLKSNNLSQPENT